jgi:hypothetical protein
VDGDPGSWAKARRTGAFWWLRVRERAWKYPSHVQKGASVTREFAFTNKTRFERRLSTSIHEFPVTDDSRATLHSFSNDRKPSALKSSARPQKSSRFFAASHGPKAPEVAYMTKMSGNPPTGMLVSLSLLDDKSSTTRQYAFREYISLTQRKYACLASHTEARSAAAN